ncbi:molybdopterin-dependent oxidoreductase [Sulfurimonas aquatica]|uniref:Molybdopterin-dependent oxidoreductase n=1 Tax=Sulfurimonas aquatica TaxID=2672570 RepID=A0A975GD70_9BACT|nr:molybdopterin-dependent oxidoreductase [Sulfurimonas aquatica]QSZ42426.1 molybdopterin-dependent oxidoreductase [Sulfurimonas aquatica]
MYLQSRRTFLKGAAFSVAGVAIAKGVFATDAAAESVNESKFTNTPDSINFYPDHADWDNFSELDGDDWKRGGIDRHGVESAENPDGIKVNNFTLVPTVCSNCEAGCGLTAWVDKETFTVKKYMGNPFSTGSRGRNCAKGYAVLSQMYDPDRIPFPLKRAPGSKRGEGKWVRTTWDEAMGAIGKKMHDTLKVGDEMSRKSIMYHVGRPNENGFGHRVPHTMGLDGYNSHTNICSAGARQGTIQWANDDRNSPDWANADLIFLQSSHAADAGHYFQQSAGLIADARKRGAKMVVLDPRMSNSAGMADLWIPAWPGTETALYLYLANRVLNEKAKNGEDLVAHDFVKEWVNWDRLMANREYIEKHMVGNGYIAEMPKGDTYEDFIKMIQELYAPFTKEYVVKECKLEGMEDKLDQLWEMYIGAGDKIATYLWRSGPIAHRGGWMITRAGFLSLVLRGALRGDVGGTSFHHWHEISVGGKGDKATVAGERAPKVDVWNEIAWPPEYPLSSYEMSHIMPHLLMDEEWQDKWTKKGLNIPKKLAVWMPRMYNPVWINPDGFRWIEALKREDKIELSFNLSPTWSETNWYCDYILPTGLAGERNDQQSTPSKPEKRTEFRQAVLRVAAEKMGWKAKDPTRATLEAHMKYGLGEIWEETEFWANIMVHHIDPDGSLGIRKYWASKKDPSRAFTVPEYFDAAFSLLPKLTAKANEIYKDEEFPVYSYMRDFGSWTEEENVYKPQEDELKVDRDYVYAHGKKYDRHHVKKDEFGALWVEHDGRKHSIGLVKDDKVLAGFHTLSKKLEFFSEWFSEWKWPEYAIPIYPRNPSEYKKMEHIVTHVHHSMMHAENEFALNTVFRLPYNIHTRSVNSKHLMEISQNHNPVWIYTKDAEKLGLKRGDAIRVRITDTVSGLESGYFVAMAVPTEGTRPGVLACSHHAGRWKLKNSVNVPGFEHALGIMGVGSPLYDMTNDGKVGTLKPAGGITPRHDVWQFKEYNKDLDNIWWDGLSGSWQNAVAPSHPDPIAGNHAWHQKVIIEKAKADDKIGDIVVNYENNMKVFQSWRDTLTRPLQTGDKLRRPQHIKRPAVPLSNKAYAVEIKDA